MLFVSKSTYVIRPTNVSLKSAGKRYHERNDVEKKCNNVNLFRTHHLVMDYGGSAVRIVASVTEDLTDIQRNGTAQVKKFNHGENVV